MKMSSYSVMICDHYKAYYKEKLLMNEITTLLTCMHPLLDINTYRHLLIISQALLMMTGRITGLGHNMGQSPLSCYFSFTSRSWQLRHISE